MEFIGYLMKLMTAVMSGSEIEWFNSLIRVDTTHCEDHGFDRRIFACKSLLSAAASTVAQGDGRHSGLVSIEKVIKNWMGVHVQKIAFEDAVKAIANGKGRQIQGIFGENRKPEFILVVKDEATAKEVCPQADSITVGVKVNGNHVAIKSVYPSLRGYRTDVRVLLEEDLKNVEVL